MLEKGQQAPNFNLEGDDGEFHDILEFRGKPLIIFFYPKDLTPGCTTEACDFSFLYDEFKSFDAQIIGVSKDNLASHTRFKGKHSLRMLLLSDPDLLVHKNYGAFGEKVLYGKKSLGVIRSTFLIDETGIIQRAWYRVRVKNHAKIVLDNLSKRPGHFHVTA